MNLIEVDWSSFLAYLFWATQSIRVLAYLPQIWSAARCSANAGGVSCWTFAYFGLSHVIGSVYAADVQKDMALALMFLANGFCCWLIVGLVWSRARSALQRAFIERNDSAFEGRCNARVRAVPRCGRRLQSRRMSQKGEPNAAS